MDKTNVMRILDRAGVSYTARTYNADVTDGMAVASATGQEPERVFKTLVTVANTREHCVFAIPVCCKLDLKKAARAAGVKSLEMIAQKQLLPLTGYVHGGCSPLGMKKALRTWIDETATLYDAITCSAGKLGAQITLAADDLCALSGAQYADLTE